MKAKWKHALVFNPTVDATVDLNGRTAPFTPEYQINVGLTWQHPIGHDRFVDPRKGVVVKRIALPVCDEPTGIAYEQRSDIVLSVCRNGTVNAVSARTRTVTDTLKVGAGPDAVMFDPTRGLFFVPSGATGELNVLQVRAGGKIKQVQRIATEVGSRTGAVDPVTGNVYVPAAKLAPPTKPGMRHSITPGTFHILVFKPG